MNRTITKHGIDSQIRNLREEVKLLRSVIISIIGEDTEGRYKPSFVKNVLQTAKEVPTSEFIELKRA